MSTQVHLQNNKGVNIYAKYIFLMDLYQFLKICFHFDMKDTILLHYIDIVNKVGLTSWPPI